MKRLAVQFSLLSLLLSLPVFGSGCLTSSDDDAGDADSTAVATAVRLVNSADSVMTLLFTSGSQSTAPAQIDAIADLYEEAVAQDPDNSKANFGAALFGFERMSVNSDIAVMTDSIQAWSQNTTNLTHTQYYVTQYFMQNLAGSDNVADDLTDYVNPVIALGSLIVLVENSLSSANTVEMFQNMLDATLIARLTTSIAQMDKVLADEDFSYTLTPAMTGEDDPMEFDLGEAYMMSAAMHVMRASFRMMNAYQFSVPGVNSLTGYLEMPSLMELVKTQDETDGTFLKLRNTTILPAAKQDLIDALANVKSAAAYVNAETDDQSDDLILQSDLSEANSGISEDFASQTDVAQNIPLLSGITSVSSLADKITSMLNSSFTVKVNDGTETVTVSLAAFLNNGIPDIKNVLPYHAWYDLGNFETGYYGPAVSGGNYTTISSTSYQEIYLELPEYYADAMGVDSLGYAGYDAYYGSISSTGVVTLQLGETSSGGYVTLSSGTELTPDGAIYLDSQNRICITSAAYQTLNTYVTSAARDSWIAFDQLTFSLMAHNYSAAHPFGVRASTGVFSFAGIAEYTGSTKFAYLTNSSGTALGEDDFPVFPDPTFGGVFPGMTQTRLETLATY